MFKDFQSKSRFRMPVTPLDPEVLRVLQSRATGSGMSHADAAVEAWRDPGSNHEWHGLMQDEFRRAMPVVAHFLDVAAYGLPDNRPRREP